MRKGLGVVLVVGLCASCTGKSPTQPAAPSSTSPTPSAGPIVHLQMKVDDGTPRDAVASMSDVLVDASTSTGSGALTFSIDFGDGTVAASATAHHAYATAGTFTIAATVTDAQGRKATDSSQVTVKAATGRWFQAEYVKRSGRVEIRQLDIGAQEGLTVRGVYRTTGNADRTFTGTLTPPRKIEIAISGGAGLLGLLPDRLDDQVAPWTLIAQGDTVDGERLDFHAIVGEPADGPPVADLKMRFGNGSKWPILAATPIYLDGSGSRGTNLISFLEFGDGTVATSSQAARTADVSGYTYFLTARVTVVDRFGRSAFKSSDYFLYDMGVRELDSWYDGGSYATAKLDVYFKSRSGASYTGSVTQRSGPSALSADMTATVSGDGNDIVIRVPAWGVEYRGTVEISDSAWQLVLVQHGGADDGKTFRLPVHGYS